MGAVMPDTYNPNFEATNSEKVVAGHWECLRRNEEFRTLSARWLASEKFRCAHALSPNYHDTEHHTPRCAWDWMLTPRQRVRLTEFQIEKLHWLTDRDFNFGMIICHEEFSPAAVTDKNWRKFRRVEPLPDPLPPVRVGQSWNCTPDLFKKQFRLAYSPPNKFEEVNTGLQELASLLRIAASTLAAGDPLKEAPIIAHYLNIFGGELREMAEFSKVFKIPKRRYSEQRFQSFLDQIHESFKASNLLVPTKTYDTHQSYQGTDEDWRWFLEAEHLGLDTRKSADLATLAARYSEDLRQRAMRGKAPRRAKAHGYSDTKFSSKIIKNRRSVVKCHVLAIQKWIRLAYPRQTPEPCVIAS